jgi:hypothetical protein
VGLTTEYSLSSPSRALLSLRCRPVNFTVATLICRVPDDSVRVCRCSTFAPLYAIPDTFTGPVQTALGLLQRYSTEYCPKATSALVLLMSRWMIAPWRVRLSALMDVYIHPLYILVTKIIFSILNSSVPIHHLYHTLSTVGPTCHFI